MNTLETPREWARGAALNALQAFGVAVASALGSWAVEEVRKVLKRPRGDEGTEEKS